MEQDELFEMIRKHEGYRNHVYLDTEGIPTGGYGHAFLIGSKIPVDIAERFLWNDIYQAEQDYRKLKLKLDPTRKAVIIDMLFNLGLTKFKKFRKLITALQSENWQKAHDEMLDSKWAGQVKGRAIELAEIMLTGIYEI